MADEAPLTINIQPPVSVYATYRRLSYKPWYAIAEFVDNSTQSYSSHRRELKQIYQEERKKLTVKIQHDSENNQLTIYDNANGMDFSELQRAIVLNCPPLDTSGRCEFGMGLKTAACWFGKRWRIETKRLGSIEKYSITVDVEEMARQKSETLIVNVEKGDPAEHYTIITIDGLYKPIQGRTAARIKEQLSSIYRTDIVWGEIEIWWGGAKLSFQPPSLLEEKLPNGQINRWWKQVNVNVPWKTENQVLKAKGWVGLLNPGSQKDAGFVLLRRGRVVVGGPDSGYKPVQIFGQGNSFKSQRLVGEINLDDWPVTQAKDAFDWSGGLEDDFIDVLKEVCKDHMKKAEGYRSDRRSSGQMAQENVTNLSSQIDASLSTGGPDYSSSGNLVQNPSSSLSMSSSLEQNNSASSPNPTHLDKVPRTFTLILHNKKWVFKVHWEDQVSDAHWMSVESPNETEIHIYLNLSHPFFEPYITDPKAQSFIQKIVVALAFAEKLARQSSPEETIGASDFRDYMNKVLRYSSQIQEEESESDDRS